MESEDYFGIPKHWGKGIYGESKKEVIEGHRNEPFEEHESPKEEREEKKSKV